MTLLLGLGTEITSFNMTVPFVLQKALPKISKKNYKLIKNPIVFFKKLLQINLSKLKRQKVF